MINPVLAYSIIWILLLLGFSLSITTNITEPVYTNTKILIGGNILGLLMNYFFIRFFDERNFRIKRNVQYIIPYKIINKINLLFTKIVVFGTLLIGIYSSGFPLLWLIAGSEKTYVNYGIPTFSGFINALYAMAVVTFLLKRIAENKPVFSKQLFLYFLFPVVVGNRGLFMMVAIQSFVTIFLFYKTGFKKFFKGIFIIICIIILFGTLGDLRLNDFDHSFKKAIVNDEYKENINHYTSGFLWVYLYTTGSINNLNSHINNVNPDYIPYHSVSGILPTVIRHLIFKRLDYPFPMVNPFINTFTAYANYLADFGLSLTLLIFLVYHYILVSLFFALKRGNIFAVFGYSSLFSAHVLSFFWDFYTIWYTILQVLVTYYFLNKKAVKSLLTPKTISISTDKII